MWLLVFIVLTLGQPPTLLWGDETYQTESACEAAVLPLGPRVEDAHPKALLFSVCMEIGKLKNARGI